MNSIQKCNRCIFSVLIILVSVYSLPVLSNDLIPIDVLFAKPAKSNVQISPDGKKISYLAQAGGVYNVWVKTIDKDDTKAVTDEKNGDIKNHFWHNNGTRILYCCDRQNNGSCNLYMKNLQTKKEKNLTPFEGFIVGDVLSYTEDNPDEVLITTKKRGAKYIDFDVCKVNLETGDIHLLNVNDGDVLNWFADEDNKVRAMKKHKNGEYEFLLKDEEGQDYKAVGILEREDVPLRFAQGGRVFYSINSNNANTKRLIAINALTRKSEIVYEDPTYDVSYAVFNPKNSKLEAVVVIKERKHWVFFDADFEYDMEMIRSLDDGDIDLSSRDSADIKWIVTFKKDNGPTTFWLFDRETKKGTFLFYDNPALSTHDFAPMEPMQFVARDGLAIEGYITYPNGIERKNLPFVLLVHGGPWGRDTWGFDPEVQWLANRGYAVLQVNFRGSTGYGKAFLHAGNKQWGQKMQDDLLDAVNWAIGQKVADPQRVCIYGFSYGGYAAIMGSALTPEKFCCAVDICGPKNLPDLVREFARRFHHIAYTFYNRIGNPQIDGVLLKEASPITYAQEIAIPVCIAIGAHDFRVRKEDAETIVTALEKNNIPHEYFFFENEGHWITKDENKMKLYETLEVFLKTHLG